MIQRSDDAMLEWHLSKVLSHSHLDTQEEEKDKLRCFHTEVLTENQSMDKLPKDAVIIQFMEGSNDVPAPVVAATDTAELHLKVWVIFRRSVVLC